MSKRTNGEGSIRHRREGLWEARYHFLDERGIRRRVSLYAKTRQGAARKLREALQHVDQGDRPTVSRDTVAAFMDAWLKDAAATLRPTSLRRYRQLVEQHIVPALGARRLADLRPEHVQGLYRSMLDQGLAPATVQTTHAVLHRAFDRAVRWNKVVRNVADVVDVPRVPSSEAPSLTIDQARMLVQAAAEDRLGALIRLAITAGLRRGELLALRWDAVDLERGALEVRHTMRPTKGGGELAEPKTRTSRRRVPLDAVMVAVLRAYRRRQVEEQIRAANLWEDRGFVFTTHLGKPLSPMVVTRAWESALRTADLPRMPFHSTRHTAASLMAAAGVNPRVSAEVLGHASISMTLDRYTHASDALRREAMARVGGILEGGETEASADSTQSP